MWGGGVYGAMLMEEAGEPQRVHASDATAALLGERGFGLRPARKYAPPHPAAAAASISSSFWLVRSTPPPSPDGRSDGHSSASAPRAGSPHLNGQPTPPPSGATQATAGPRRYRPLDPDPVAPPAAKGWGQLRGIHRGIRPGELASLSSAVHVLGRAPPGSPLTTRLAPTRPRHTPHAARRMPHRVGNLSFEASSELPSLRSANWQQRLHHVCICGWHFMTRPLARFHRQKWHSSPVALHLRRSGFELSTPMYYLLCIIYSLLFIIYYQASSSPRHPTEPRNRARARGSRRRTAAAWAARLVPRLAPRGRARGVTRSATRRGASPPSPPFIRAARGWRSYRRCRRPSPRQPTG